VTSALTSRAAVRRAMTSLPDAGRLSLAAPLATAALTGELPATVAAQALAAYLLDPRAFAILATDDALARWLAGPLFQTIGPANAVPLSDQIAALIAAPALVRDGGLSPLITRYRFAPRADDVVALAIASLDIARQPAAVEALFADRGPQPELLALSTIQCGRALAWAPHLLEWPIAETVVNALLRLLDASRPQPLLEQVGKALGPIAARPGALAERVRSAALAGIDAAPVPAASFSAELAAIGKRRVVPEMDRMLALPRLEQARACAYILGFAAPTERETFVAHQAQVLDRPDGGELFVAFVDGLVAAAHVPAVSELVAEMFDSGTAGAALSLAAALPLDPLGPALIAELDSPSADRRVLAASAVELLAGDTPDNPVDRALALRLADPVPDVVAAATRALVARGRADLVADHAARDDHPVRSAIARASAGDLDVAVVGELARGLLGDDEERDGASPTLRVLADALLGSAAGLDVASDLIGGVPELAGLLALAAAADADRDAGILAPPAARQRLAEQVVRLAGGETGNDDGEADELIALAIYLLSRVSAGDTEVAALAADALTATDGHAGTLIGALAEVRVANDRTAAALAPLLAADQPIGARITAAAAAGRVLPAGHAAWAAVRELLELGTIARSAAWSAFRDLARRTPPKD